MHRFERLKPVALLLLRLGLGVIFIFHGSPKLFGDTERFVQFFTSVGLPGYLVHVAGIVEVFGGLLLITGLFTRMAGLLLAGQMAVAIWKAHSGRGVLAVDAYEFPLVLALASFVLTATGAGAVSLDRALFKDKS